MVPPVGKHALLHFAHHPEHLCRMWPQILRELVLDRLADLHEAALVDVFDDLDAHLFQLCQRLVLKLEGDVWLVSADLIGCCLHPLFLLVGQARPSLVADEECGVICLVFGKGEHGCRLVMFVDEVVVDAVFGHVHDAGLQSGINFTERHMHNLGAVGRKRIVFRHRCLHAHLYTLEVPDILYRLFAVHVAQSPANRGRACGRP